MVEQTRTHDVGSFGEQLRQARQAQNMTLQEIAATTKISSRALQALESEHFEQLPGGIFNKGFVRAYARCVGLDEEKMLAAYMAVAKPDASEADIQTISSQIAAAQGPAKESRVGGTTLMGVLALIVALGLGAVWLREQRKEAREAREQAVAAAAPVATPPAQASPATAAVPPDADANEAVPANATRETSPGPGEAATSKTAVGAEPNAALNVPPNTSPNASPNAGLSASQNAAVNAAVNAAPKATPNPPAANPTAKSGAAPDVKQSSASTQDAPHDAAAGEGKPAPVEVSISATQPAWISVRSDGKKVAALTLNPEKPELRSRSYKAQQTLKLTVGNAGGITVSYNGKPVGLLGPAGSRKVITFTPQGMEKQ